MLINERSKVRKSLAKSSLCVGFQMYELECTMAHADMLIRYRRTSAYPTSETFGCKSQRSIAYTGPAVSAPRVNTAISMAKSSSRIFDRKNTGTPFQALVVYS